MRIEVVKKDPEAIVPSQAYDGDAGYDLHCLHDGVLKPGERRLYKTGVALAIPKGFYGQIAPRSGWAFKYGIDTLAGVIDSGYRDEIGVILINFGDKNFSFEKGDRIAQLIIKRCEQVDFFPVQNFSEKTERGLGGFGSSNGIKKEIADSVPVHEDSQYRCLVYHYDHHEGCAICKNCGKHIKLSELGQPCSSE